MLVANVFEVKRGEWMWRVRRGSAAIAMSGRTYKTPGRCIQGLRTFSGAVKKNGGLTIRVYENGSVDTSKA